MALRERNDCTEEALVPRALAIQSSLLPSSPQRRMSSVNFLSDTLLFIPTRPTARCSCCLPRTSTEGRSADSSVQLYLVRIGLARHRPSWQLWHSPTRT